ncbi:acyl-CoA dehydrogenase family protein [Saccharospirillum salsuginis]|uniref:Acyl-CoA dehydrogenase n=1 Tax=Saccharospirillum salsuginis TaxID=418750 RepID=A0A918KQV9_9GAMM|nr:acyl-CoA dehydrogenase family protein [Saccharospirillum salsuginis]GGX72390.1 putative acyl-CoA dehydrogenase [Saccharospirillum salsuginis]
MVFDLSERAQATLDRVRQIVDQEIIPLEAPFNRAMKNPDRGWQLMPEIEALKQRCRDEGLWNLFLPVEPYGAGFTNTEYAHMAEAMGRSHLAPEVFNCNAPDTGNMEVLVHYGSEAQQKRWLKPLLNGEIRSAFCMTEPDVASSDATNMQATATLDGDEVVLNGRKWWSTGIGHPNCELLIFMGLTDPDAPRHQQHSMVLVPKNHPGVTVERLLPVFGSLHEPYGHGEVSFTDVRLPRDAIVAGPGRGFEIAQGRLGPGRIHHAMRAIGAAERTLQLMIERGLSRTAFGKPLIKLGGNLERVADHRMAINQARLLCLHTATLIDRYGIRKAYSEVSQIKIVAANVLQRVADDAIQLFGGAGVSDDLPLADLWANGRVLRLADGPDEVHRATIAKQELKRYEKR